MSDAIKHGECVAQWCRRYIARLTAHEKECASSTILASNRTAIVQCAVDRAASREDARSALYQSSEIGGATAGETDQRRGRQLPRTGEPVADGIPQMISDRLEGSQEL